LENLGDVSVGGGADVGGGAHPSIFLETMG